MYEFKLPDLGEGIHEGELLKWYVNVGDNINEDDPLCDVETDKAAVTIPSPRGGIVKALNGNVGDTLHVGNVITVIDDGSGEAEISVETDNKQEAQESKSPCTNKDNLPVKVDSSSKSNGSERVAAAPATRRLAREMNIDIKLVKGTGPGGRVLVEDLKNFAQGKTPEISSADDSRSQELMVPATVEAELNQYTNAPIPFFEVVKLPDFEEYGPVEREPVRSIRRKVALKTTSSMILVPHVAHMDEADVTVLEDFRRNFMENNKDDNLKITLLPFVLKAVASLLKKYPMFNSSLDPYRQEIIYKKYYNMGFAADTPRGLIVPVVHNVDRRSILQIAEEIVTLAKKGQDGSIEAGELRNGTFSITNVGPIGGTGLIPTINYPEAAILGMGRVQEKPVVRNGEIVIRKMLPLTLAFDHRIADGAQAARFTTDLIRLLSDPNILLMAS